MEDGTKVDIPATATKKSKVDLAPLVDKKVTLKGKGIEKKAKKKTIYLIRTVASVEEVATE